MKIGGTLDRYVAFSFLKAFGVSLLTVLGLFTVLDLAANVDEYLRSDSSQATSAATLALFYLLNLPFLYQQAEPFIVMGACLYTLVRIVQTREWIAVIGAGISTRRMVAPMMLLAVFLSAAGFGLREAFLPQVRETRDAVRQSLVPDPEVFEKVWVRDRAGHPVYVERLDGDRIFGLEADVPTEDGWTMLRAAEARYERDPGGAGGRWVLEDARQTDVGPGAVANSQPRALEALDFTPEDVLLVVRAREDPMSLSLREIDSMAARDPDNGQLRTLVQALWASTATSLVFLLLALPMAVKSERAAVVKGVLLGVLLCFLHFVVDLVCRSLGMEGSLPPSFAAWLPVVVSGSLGLVLFGSLKT